MEFCFDIVGFKQYIFGFNVGHITLNKRLILWLNLLLDDDQFGYITKLGKNKSIKSIFKKIQLPHEHLEKQWPSQIHQKQFA
jgi:hypothetical protein